MLPHCLIPHESIAKHGNSLYHYRYFLSYLVVETSREDGRDSSAATTTLRCSVV